MDDLGKIQYANDKHHAKRAADGQATLALRRVTKAQKEALFKAIRYSHLPHAELISLGKNPVFQEGAKDFILQGLSFRLNPFEGAKPLDQLEKENIIVLTPRKSYIP